MNPRTQTTTLLAPNSLDPANAKTNSRKVFEEKAFTFDKSFWSHRLEDDHYAHQEDVYKSFGEEFLDHNFDGYHTCIFAYGQTGSGKSYTMMGTPEQPGLIPRTCRELFGRIERDPSPNTTYNVHVSYFEVYNEHVRDLLVPRTNPPHYLKIRESQTDGVYVQGLTDAPAKNYEDVERLMKMGDSTRTTASTKMNDTSSRSHAVFTIQLKQIQHSLTTDETIESSARMRLVDLAGSERAKATEATGQRLLEGGKINKSLTTLGRVIAALADPRRQGGPNGTPRKAAPRDIVPYRDSVLTWLLKDSLGGNSKTAMVACISPCDYDETLSTLRYADQAKRIRTRATANVDAISAAERDAQIEMMAETIRSLQTTINVTRVRREKEEEGLEDYQKQVNKMQRLMEETRAVSDAKVKALAAEAEELRVANEKLVDETAALRRHLGLVLGELKNPIVIPSAQPVASVVPVPAMTTIDFEYTAEDKENGQAKETDGEGYIEPEATHGDWAAEVSEEANEFLKELGLFRRKIGDDTQRFGSRGPLVEVRVN
ncbi:kinesin-domain-containing protein [Eremomyces bilateralis CBS 781.70]|uniref:Kinesin-like protein n=1 Tax=Eremomyces bilateralis CBS 781.70 TaxID=1392243 RepID=A0A6G1GC27_9PEZI|nr:kinesin-domain-containing protein [Eremomyces bilateralis CBS 781.70]KAF1815593.1 kinesin-domain-containing protein [Eremomyces bilateralis CBS 781.70]